MDVLFHDNYIIVCIKPAGVSSEEAGINGMPALLRAESGCADVYPVHRLDTAAAGLMVYAKTAAAAAALSKAITEGIFQKEYLAAVHGRPAEPAGEYADLLFKDARKNKTYTVKTPRRGVREARLSYTVIANADTRWGEGSLVRIRLQTGRTHQIRVQFASRKTPLFGDGKYGAKDHCPQLMLFSCALRFPHPVTGAPMAFERLPEGETWNVFLKNCAERALPEEC